MRHQGGGLHALERIVELRLELARLSLALAQRAARDKALAVHDAVRVQCEAAAAGADLLQGRWDAGTHREVLDHLALLALRRQQTESAAADADAALETATRHAIELDRRLAVLQRLQRQRARVRAGDEQRAADREADLHALLHAGARRDRARQDGGAA